MPLAALALGTGPVAGLCQKAAAAPGLRADPASLPVRAEADRAVAATSGDRTLAVVYGPNRREVILDVGELNGPALLIRWFDPATGERSKEDVVKLGADRHFTLIAPAIAGRQPRDWLLVLNRTIEGRVP